MNSTQRKTEEVETSKEEEKYLRRDRYLSKFYLDPIKVNSPLPLLDR